MSFSPHVMNAIRNQAVAQQINPGTRPPQPASYSDMTHQGGGRNPNAGNPVIGNPGSGPDPRGGLGPLITPPVGGGNPGYDGGKWGPGGPFYKPPQPSPQPHAKPMQYEPKEPDTRPFDPGGVSPGQGPQRFDYRPYNGGIQSGPPQGLPQMMPGSPFLGPPGGGFYGGGLGGMPGGGFPGGYLGPPQPMTDPMEPDPFSQRPQRQFRWGGR